MKHEFLVEDESKVELASGDGPPESGNGQTLNGLRDETPASANEHDGTFLTKLRARMEQTLLLDAEEPRKVTLGDYLKLAALIESTKAASATGPKEVVVRWEDPSFETKGEADSN